MQHPSVSSGLDSTNHYELNEGRHCLYIGHARTHAHTHAVVFKSTSKASAISHARRRFMFGFLLSISPCPTLSVKCSVQRRLDRNSLQRTSPLGTSTVFPLSGFSGSFSLLGERELADAHCIYWSMRAVS